MTDNHPERMYPRMHPSMHSSMHSSMHPSTSMQCARVTLPRRVLHWTALFLLASTAACGDEGRAAAEPREEVAASAEAAERAEAANGAAGPESAEEGETTGATRVSLSEAAFANARIAVEPARAEAVSAASTDIEVPAEVEFDPARVALISPRVGGRVERLLAVPGERVAAGQTVALLYTPAYLTAQTDLQQAKRRRDLLAGSADAEGADALVAAARRRLLTLGVTDSEVRALEDGAEPKSLLAVRAPFAGSITERTALVGAAVESGAPLYTIADLSVVNVAANVPERLHRAVRPGQAAVVRVAAAPEATILGRVTRISDQVDASARTVEALVQVANTGRLLKPGMFATVTIRDAGHTSGATMGSVASQTEAGAVSVPAAAVVADGDGRYVFVQVGPRTFERRTVELAPAPRGAGPARAGSRVIVISGLRAGEMVVARGAFTLKSELGKAEFGEEEGE